MKNTNIKPNIKQQDEKHVQTYLEDMRYAITPDDHVRLDGCPKYLQRHFLQLSEGLFLT